MKKLITAMALLFGTLFLAPASVQADSYGRRISHHCNSCRTPVYMEQVLIGYNSCGQRVYGWRQVGHACRPVVQPYRPVYQGYQNNCGQPVYRGQPAYRGHGHGHGGISIQTPHFGLQFRR